MYKKINSSVNIDNDNFKIKIGTTDKKNPSSIYFECGTYVAPIEIDKSYKDKISSIENGINTIAKQISKTAINPINNKILFNGKTIVNVEMSELSLLKNNRVYLTFQCYFKQDGQTIMDFKSLSENTNQITHLLTSQVSELLKENGFTYSKTKK